jgi:hypothetical protein
MSQHRLGEPPGAVPWPWSSAYESEPPIEDSLRGKKGRYPGGLAAATTTTTTTTTISEGCRSLDRGGALSGQMAPSAQRWWAHVAYIMRVMMHTAERIPPTVCCQEHATIIEHVRANPSHCFVWTPARVFSSGTPSIATVRLFPPR